MNTDHINYQQQIAQSVNEEKDHELIEKTDNLSKPISSTPSSSSSNSIGIHSNPTTTNEEQQRLHQNSENTMNILTPVERRERILTLIIIALIALLTGRNPFSSFDLWKENPNTAFFR